MNCFLGLDIGLTGGIAIIDANRRVRVAPLPTIDTGNEKYLDAKKLHQLLLEWVPVGDRAVIVVEDVQARSIGNSGRATNSMHSQGSMMQSKGIVRAVIALAGIQPVWVQPQTWKRQFGLRRLPDEKDTAVKDRARLLAIDLFPAMAEALKTKNSHNRAEALLMARYGQLTQA